MVISGVVLTLDLAFGGTEATVAALLHADVFHLGVPHGARLPLVLESATASESESWYQWLAALPGVAKVDLAYVAFEDSPSRASSLRTDGQVPSRADSRSSDETT